MNQYPRTEEPSPDLRLPENAIPHALPRPEKKRAVLFNGEAFTPHVYSETRLTDKAHRGTLGYEFVFTCVNTNRRRRFGFERIPGDLESALDEDGAS